MPSTKLTDFKPMQRELTRLTRENEELRKVLAEYVMLGSGRCTISKAHADWGWNVLNRTEKETG